MFGRKKTFVSDKWLEIKSNNLSESSSKIACRTESPSPWSVFISELAEDIVHINIWKSVIKKRGISNRIKKFARKSWYDQKRIQIDKPLFHCNSEKLQFLIEIFYEIHSINLFQKLAHLCQNKDHESNPINWINFQRDL